MKYLSFLIVLVIGLRTNGQQVANQITMSNGTLIGFYQFTPEDYQSNPGKKYPTIIFMHGLGERGNGKGELYKVLKHGIPKNIQAGHKMKFFWNGKWESFIVLSPQLSTTYGSWQRFYVDEMLKYAKASLPIDENRIIITGLSLGGGGTWSFATRDEATAKGLAAIAPVCGTYRQTDMSPLVKANVPVWAFHASNDDVVAVSNTHNAVNGILTHNPSVLPYKTIWPDGKHGIWDRAYDTSYKWQNPNMYEWMLAQNKSFAINKRPVAEAGNEIQTTVGQTVELNASTSTDIDGTIQKYIWRKISGPGGEKIASPVSTNGRTGISSLVEGSYSFEVKVIDDRADYSLDTVKVIVSKEAPNRPPTVQVGPDQIVNTTTALLNGIASDEDGTIISYNWTRQSGPAGGKIESANAAATAVSDLNPGTYYFRLTVTDNRGATSFAELKLIVSALGIPQPKITGPDKIILPANSASFDASQSISPNGNIVSYKWNFLSGPNQYSIDNNDQPVLNLSSLVQGRYGFQLTVTDERGVSAQLPFHFEVQAAVPINSPVQAAISCSPVVELPGDMIKLAGTPSKSTAGAIVTYRWTILEGAADAVLVGPNNRLASVKNLKTGSYKIRLTVIDAKGNSGSCETTIDVTSANPVQQPKSEVIARIDGPGSITTNQTTLDGSKSSSTAGNIVSYRWTKISGPASFLIPGKNNRKTLVTNLVPGTYVFRLTVLDGNGGFAETEKTITVGNIPGQHRMSSEAEEIIASKHQPVKTSMKAYPNPAINNLKVELYSEENGAGSLCVYDINGRLVQKQNFEKSNQLYQQTLDIASLSKGIYHVELSMGKSARSVAKFVKQ